MAAKKETEVVEIRPLDIKEVKIKVVGDTPLIVHAWSEKCKRQMLEAQMKATKTKAKEIRDPFDDYINSMYWLTEKPESTPEAFEMAVKNGAKWGFPVGAIKMAANSAAYRLGWVKNQMGLRGAYFLKSEFGDMAQIITENPPVMREDMVRIGLGSADLRYRGEFRDWSMELTLEYNASGDMTLEQIVNVINAGGYTTGLGEWRPEKDGTFGRFHIENA